MILGFLIMLRLVYGVKDREEISRRTNDGGFDFVKAIITDSRRKEYDNIETMVQDIAKNVNTEFRKRFKESGVDIDEMSNTIMNVQLAVYNDHENDLEAACSRDTHSDCFDAVHEYITDLAKFGYSLREKTKTYAGNLFKERMLMVVGLFGAGLISTLEGHIGLNYDPISGAPSKWITDKNEQGQIFDISQTMTGVVSQTFAVVMALVSIYFTKKSTEMDLELFGKDLIKRSGPMLRALTKVSFLGVTLSNVNTLPKFHHIFSFATIIFSLADATRLSFQKDKQVHNFSSTMAFIMWLLTMLLFLPLITKTPLPPVPIVDPHSEHAIIFGVLETFFFLYVSIMLPEAMRLDFNARSIGAFNDKFEKILKQIGGVDEESLYQPSSRDSARESLLSNNSSSDSQSRMRWHKKN